MSEFYFSYDGNKRHEIQKILSMCNFENVKTIVECFGGTCYFSFYLYNNYKNNNFHFVITDINEDLTYFCNNFYKNQNEIITNSIKIIEQIDNNKEKYNDYINKKLKYYDEGFIEYFLIFNTYYNIRKGLFPIRDRTPKYIKYENRKEKYNEFFKNNEYICSNFIDILEKYKNDETALIYLDPPYVQADCQSYFKQTIDWEYLVSFFETAKCKIVLHVNFNIWMDRIFKNICKKSIHYNFKYQHKNRKKTTGDVIHSIYINYDL